MAGRKAGLLSANDLKLESERKREREAEMFAKMDPSISGKGSETVYRDKMGRKKDIKLDRIKKREEERKEMEDNEKFMEWGRGWDFVYLIYSKYNLNNEVFSIVV